MKYFFCILMASFFLFSFGCEPEEVVNDEAPEEPEEVTVSIND